MTHSPGFVHLRVHSEYSVIDGLVRVRPLIEKTAALRMPAVAITDHVNLYALIKFYSAASQAGIKPICGCDVLVAEDDNPEQFSTLVLLVQNQTGYRNLTELISRAHVEGQFRGNPCIRRSWLEGASDGLIALSGARSGDIGRAMFCRQQNHDASRLVLLGAGGQTQVYRYCVAGRDLRASKH